MTEKKEILRLNAGDLVIDKDTKFNGQPIVWRVADKNHERYPANTVTLISDKILAQKRFDHATCDYKNSEIRKWLNDEDGFMKEFYTSFKKSIKESTISYRDYESSYVSDKVFLASVDEVGYGSGYTGRTFPILGRYNGIIGEDLNNIAVDWWLRTNSNWTRVHYCSNTNSWRSAAPYEIKGIRPVCNIDDNIYVSDGVNSEGMYEIIWNKPPSKPASFTLPDKVISRTETDISWAKSTDPENDPISYRLERSLDGGEFVERYKGSFTRYKDIIEDKGHTSVVYRVTAIDSNGNESESLTSASVTVSDNTIPVIETASVDLGKITAAYSVAYKVVDPDEGQTWTVTESLDGKVLKTFDAKVGTSYTSKMTPSDWQKVLNGNHVLKIEVVDSDGGKTAKEINFEKAITKLDFMLDKKGLQGIDKMPERAILSMSASIPSGASIKIEITNNALDDKPVWQDCTAQVLGNEKIFFSNKTKTAAQWAVNVRVSADKKTATEVLSVSSIGGFYD